MSRGRGAPHSLDLLTRLAHSPYYWSPHAGSSRRRWLRGWGTAWRWRRTARSSPGAGTRRVRRPVPPLLPAARPIRRRHVALPACALSAGRQCMRLPACFSQELRTPCPCPLLPAVPYPALPLPLPAPAGQLGLGQFVAEQTIPRPTPIYGIPSNRWVGCRAGALQGVPKRSEPAGREGREGEEVEGAVWGLWNYNCGG